MPARRTVLAAPFVSHGRSVKPRTYEHEAAIADHDEHFTSRAQKYREAARLLRSAAEMIGPMLANDVLEIAKELEELADVIERLRVGDE
jgi:hypothetical protein